MERKTLLLDFMTMLTLVAMAKGASAVPRTTMDVQDLVCRWQQSNDRLVCGFTQLGPDHQYSLTLDNSTTVRCQQTIHNKNQIQCIYEGLQEKKFVNNKSHKFELHLGTGNEVQTQEFSLSVVEESHLASIMWVILGSGMLIISILFVLYCTIVRLRQMSDISVMLPDFNSEDNLTNIQAQK